MPTIYNELTGAGSFIICTVPTDKIYRLQTIIIRSVDSSGSDVNYTWIFKDVVATGVEEKRYVFEPASGQAIQSIPYASCLFVGTVKLELLGGNLDDTHHITLVFKEVEAC